MNIGYRSVFKFSAPFNLIGVEKQYYTVVAIANILEFKNVYGILYDAMYETIPDSETLKEEHLNDNVDVVTLQLDSGPKIFVPVSAIELDDIGKYREFVKKTLIVDLGAFETNVNFDDLLEDIRTLTLKSLGIDPSITVMDTSRVALTNVSVIEAVEAERELLKATVENSVSNMDKLLTDLEKANLKIIALEEYIEHCN